MSESEIMKLCMYVGYRPGAQNVYSCEKGQKV